MFKMDMLAKTLDQIINYVYDNVYVCYICNDVYYIIHAHTHINITVRKRDRQKEDKYLSVPTAYVTDLIWLIIMSPGWGG